MIFRDWQYQDIQRIAEMEKACFKDPWNFKMLADSLLSNNFVGVVAVENETIIGYGGAIFNGVDGADILNIAVDEEFRNRKIGERILKKLTEKCLKKGVVEIFLEVRVSNNYAQMLYLKNGFKGISVRQKYYPDGEDALIMKYKKD